MTDPTSSTKPRVFVTRRIPQRGLDPILAATDCDLWAEPMPPDRQSLLERARGCEGLLTMLSDRVDAEFFDAAGPQLKVVSNFAVGVNNIDLAEAARRGIAVGHTPEVLTDATADIAVALLLAAARHLKSASDEVRQGRWKTWEPTGWLGCDLVGRTVGIIGMGRIGAAVARRLHGGWGMEVLFSSRSEKVVPGVPTARHFPLDEVLRRADFVSVHTDLTDETRGLIGHRALALMKPSAILINTSRGPVVDQDALHQALSTGKLFAAGLDVTDPEPLPGGHPLLALENCIILPHIGSATREARDAMAAISAENLLAGVQGRPLRHAV